MTLQDVCSMISFTTVYLYLQSMNTKYEAEYKSEKNAFGKIHEVLHLYLEYDFPLLFNFKS